MNNGRDVSVDVLLMKTFVSSVGISTSETKVLVNVGLTCNV